MKRLSMFTTDDERKIENRNIRLEDRFTGADTEI